MAFAIQLIGRFRRLIGWVFRFLKEILNDIRNLGKEAYSYASDIIPKWSALKTFSNSKFALYAIFIPLIGWIIIINNQIIFEFYKTTGLSTNFNLSWKTHAFYIGLFIISISSVLHILFCPTIISHHKDENEYIEKTYLIVTESMMRMLIKHTGQDEVLLRRPTNFAGEDTYSRAQWLSLNQREIYETLYLSYVVANKKFAIIRLMVLIAFVCGTIIMLVPSFATLQWSTCQFYADQTFFKSDQFNKLCP